MTLEEFFYNHYWPLKTSTLRECTLAGYESAWRVHIEPNFGTWELDTIKAREIEQWFLTFKTPGAARKAWAVLRTILRTAVRYEYLEVDPTQKVVEVPKREKYIAPTLSKDEVYKLLEGMKGSLLEEWVLVAATTGLRKEESAALLWSDIDLETGAIIVNKGVQWIKGREIINPPKTLMSYRTVYLPDFARKRLKVLYETMKYTPDSRLIGKIHVGKLTPHFKSECRKRNLPYVPPRCLRHTWATIALAEGVPISIVSRCLGHYDVSTTARYYISPKKEDLIFASKTYNDIFEAMMRPCVRQKQEIQQSLDLLDHIKDLF